MKLDTDLDLNNCAGEIELERKCYPCLGLGRRGGEDCVICDGEGAILTENGQTLLGFIKKYGAK